MYLDSAYLAKYYVNERDSTAVRAVIEQADSRVSSAWVLAELPCVFQRHVREGALSPAQAKELLEAFLKHVDQGVWTLYPVTLELLRSVALSVSALPADVFLRAGDATHLTTARD